ncbi:MAG: Cytochrome c class, partial [Frankiales bacterium]|nr:Cytochrome c class [Frankiales bacterium]
FVGSAWGNKLAPFTAQEVAKVRKTSRNFPTYAALVKASEYAPLPKAPEGWTVREVAQLTEPCTRLAGNGQGDIYLLSQRGNVFRIDAQTGGLEQRIRGIDYLEPDRGDVGSTGMTQDAEGRLWITCNRQLKDETHYIKEITI